MTEIFDQYRTKIRRIFSLLDSLNDMLYAHERDLARQNESTPDAENMLSLLTIIVDAHSKIEEAMSLTRIRSSLTPEQDQEIEDIQNKAMKIISSSNKKS